MSVTPQSLFSPGAAPTFSGHETFALRSNWLKKAYDLLCVTPELFSQEHAFAQLGVGKNMAQSIRFWGRVCGVFERTAGSNDVAITPLGHALLADDGWDPFLVSPASHWLLHWHVAARPTAAFSFFYTFNLLKGGEFSVAQLGQQIQTYCAENNFRAPSTATIGRDLACMVDCYCRPEAQRLAASAEDLLLCPLLDLGLMQRLPGQHVRLVTSAQPDLPDALIAFAIGRMMRDAHRDTITFSDLAYAPFSPGRVFRLAEDALLSRLQVLRETTEGRAYYTDQAGIRQVAWPNVQDPIFELGLLAQAFAAEVAHA